MKKILSAVFIITMLIIAATITGSVFAAEPYVFDPESEGLANYPVIYLDEENGTLKGTDEIAKSTDSENAYKSMSAAVGALKTADTEGYIILVSDSKINTSSEADNVFGWASSGSLPTHSKMVIIRGMTREDGSKAKLYLGGMPQAQGPLWFQNLDFVSISKADTYIVMHGHDLGWGTPGAGADDISFSKATSANGVTPADAAIVIAGDGGTYTRSPIVDLYSGKFNLELKVTGAYGETTLNGDITINNHGTDMSGGKITHKHGKLDTLNGDLYINVMGGKLPATPTLVDGTASYINGNIHVNISGTPDLTNLTRFNIAGYVAATPAGLKGTATLDMTGYKGSDKDTVVARIRSVFGTVLSKSVIVSDAGDDSAAGTADAPVKTLAKAVELLGGSNGAVFVKDILTIDDVAEATRTNNVIIRGFDDGAQIIINGDYVIGGPTTFTDIAIVNGVEGAIVAGGKKLTIAEDVTTSAGDDGKYIDLVAGVREGFVAVDITVNAGTYNIIDPAGLAGGSNIEISSDVKTVVSGVRADSQLNAFNLANGAPENAFVEVIDFVDGKQAAKILPDSNITSIIYTGKFDGAAYKFASLEYYLNLKDTDSLNIRPQLVINGVPYDAEQATADNGWNVASFDLSAVGEEFNEFTFYPYGQNAVAEYNKMYLLSFTFSQLKSVTAPDYGKVNVTENGDYIPVLEDLVMAQNELINPFGRANVEIEETAFVAGLATMYTPKASDGVQADYYISKGGVIDSIRGDFQPYVRVEYYAYGKTDEAFGDVKPTIIIDGKPYEAAEKLELNKWSVATFNIGDYTDYFQEFSFKPYGDATGLNEWNKMYIQQIVFSQTENLAAPGYAAPNMGDDGTLIPYKFTPDDGLPVVYYAPGGTYEGDYKGSDDSRNAYGKLSKAVSAIDEAGGGYVILCDDYSMESESAVAAPSMPEHKNMVIIRGKESDDDDKITFTSWYMTNAKGPTTFENLVLNWISNPYGNNSDLALRSGKSKLVIGKFGVENDVIYKKYDGDNTLTLTGSDIVINSGSFSVRLGEYGASETYDSVNITLNGGTLTSIAGTINHSGANGGAVSTTTVNGQINININGGVVKLTGITNAGYFRGSGTLSYNVTGGDFTSVSAGAIVPFVSNRTYPATYSGTTILNLLDYDGDIAALRTKFVEARFDKLDVNTVYLSDDGSENGDGSKANPVSTLEKAHELLTQGPDSTKTYSGKIVISGSGFTVSDDVVEPEHSSAVTYNSDGNAAIKFEGGKFILSGDVDFKNVKFSVNNADSSSIVANGHKLNIADTVTCTKVADAPYLNIIGGKESGEVDSVDVTISGGDFGDVKAGGSVAGNVNIRINGGTIHGKIVGGTSEDNGVIGGNSAITINGGTIDGEVIGGNEAAGTINGTATIVLNGGTFTSNAEIIATNENADAVVNGNAIIEITGGDFAAMGDGAIKAGAGTCNDKIVVNAESAPAGAAGKIENNDKIVTIAPPAPKPTFSAADKVIHIIATYGDATGALKEPIPFTVTQTAKQTATPVVVSPKHLNIKVDGSDHAIMTLETIKYTTDTIRFVPNHNPAMGSSIVVDGYNINGRGVDVSTHKYIEIVYYYTVPEGETPAVQNMGIQYLGDFSGKIRGTSTDLVPNKWATAVIDLTEASWGFSGALKQYHFSPMGFNKKGTDVPTSQYIDIASMTFYSDMPSTVIKGGNAPRNKAAMGEEKKPVAPSKPTTIEDIVVNVVRLKSTVDNSGAFTAAQVTKDGINVMEYTPSLDSEMELRIEGYDCMGKAISLNEYQYLTMKVFVETERTDATFTPAITILRGGVADNPAATKVVTVKSEVNLVPNEWTTVTLRLTPADPAFHITRQFHIAPIGTIKGSAMKEGEKFYLAEFVLSAQPPKAPGAADGEVIEEEVGVIEEAAEIVVPATKLINSAGDSASFKSTVEVFDGKQVVKINPANVTAPVAIDGTAIFGNTELTPDGALSLKTHRYAVISYYYATEDTEAERIPEFTLLGGRIQDMGDVVNGVVAKGTAGLKKNEWATAVVRLSDNGTGVLTSGFTLRPFGNTSAANLANGDILYIENITFVSNRPQ